MIPVLKAIKHEKSVEELNISENLLSDKTVKVLCEILPTLDGLHTLNLSSNMFTCQSISYISEMFKNSSQPILKSLQELNLSYNLLNDSAIKFLSVITSFVKLKVVNLKGCGMSFGTEETYDLDLNEMRNLNISENEIKLNNLGRVFSNINGSILTHIDLSSVTVSRSESVTNELITVFSLNSPVNLQYLNLSRCNVNDFEFKNLLVCLKHSSKLKTLNLSHNKELSLISFRSILESQLCEHLIIDNCFDILTALNELEIFRITESVNKMPKLLLKLIKLNCREPLLLCLLTNFWKNVWSEKAVILRGFNSHLQLTIK